MKYFVSCIIPGQKQVGAIQFEAEDLNEMQQIAEAKAPCRCEFKAWELQEFEGDMPIGEFVDAARLKELGY